MGEKARLKGSVLVIGSGVSGMRASAELVQQGFKVFLLESKPTIGGAMAQLDKMYPTNECATCTLLPKMLELTSNPNVSILAFADLEEVRPSETGFTVRVVKHVRYVDPAKCTACTECFAPCPVGGVPKVFNFGRGASKAISFWSPFPPRKALIDPEACTYIKNGTCGEGSEPLCAAACEPGAIDFSQQPSTVELEVGGIIVATGAVERRGEMIAQYGHGTNPNVMTSLEFERLLSGLGPTGGVVKRDDGTVPKRLAWIVCADFADEKTNASVGAMIAAAEALGTVERDSETEVVVINAGNRSNARGHEAFRAAAEEQGVRFLTAGSVRVEETEDGTLVRLDDGKETIPVELLVLATPMDPPASLPRTAEAIGFALDGNGRPQSGAGGPLTTTVDGAFVAGTIRGPTGIRESVIEACGAAASAAARLADARGTELAAPPVRELLAVDPEDDAKIAVVICRCGANIAGALDLDELVEYVSGLPNVAKVETTPFGCDGVKIKELLATGEYNRLVVGGCSPRTHEPLFQMISEAGGLNRYLMEIVNLRNQCTWVHRADPEGLARKAKTLMRVGVARAALQVPLEGFSIPVTQRCLVVGGGAAGLSCAAKLGEMGFATHLVMAENSIGEVATADAAMVAPVRAEVEACQDIRLHAGARLGAVEGYVGNYRAEIVAAGASEVVDVGAVVIATKTDMGGAADGASFEDSLYLTRDDDGLFVGALGNLNPLDFNTEGVFLCGDAREADEIEGAIISGQAAASRVACILANERMEKSPVISRIIDENCDGCAYCVEPCPAHAITLIEYRYGEQIKKTVEVNDALCRGCGMCAATCPKQGAFVHHFKPEYLAAMANAVLEGATS